MITFSESVCVNILPGNELIYGVGNEIHIINKTGPTILRWKFPRIVHGIETDNEKRILLYGERYFMLFSYSQGCLNLLHSNQISDWISGAKILSNQEICLVTAHSVAVRLKYDCENKSLTIIERRRCSDKSTLYCSFLLGWNWDDLTVFGGNAFGEVLIWSPAKYTLDSCYLMHRLKAHSGVVFSIHVNSDHRMMTTTSDDRSMKLWNLETDGDECKLNWEKTRIAPNKSCFGHTARVFHARIILEKQRPYVISCGEDYNLCLWDSEGTLLHRIKQGFGSVRNFVYDLNTKTIFSCTSSGNIFKYGLECAFSSNRVKEVKFIENNDYPAKVKYIGKRNIIATSHKGEFVLKLSTGQWKSCGQPFSSKCTVLEVFENIVMIGGYKTLLLYKFHPDTEELELVFQDDVMSSSIRYVCAFSKDEYLISDDSGLCKLSKNQLITLYEFKMNRAKKPWATAALRTGNTLLISNGHGHLFAYTQSNDSFHLKSTIKNIHGCLGITQMTFEKEENGNYYFKTCGHDSTVKIVKFNHHSEQMTKVHTERVPVSWIATLEKINRDIFAIGFNDNHFIVWERKLGFVLELSCGGGHRYWDVKIDALSNIMQLIYIKNKRLYSYVGPINNVSENSLFIGHHFWHTKVCNVLRVVSISTSDTFLLISGGEDNILKVFIYDLVMGTHFICEIYLHISSIKAIEIVKLSNDSYLIISAGGRAQICVSEFYLKSLSIEERCDFMLKSSDLERNFQRCTQDIDFDPETRIMDLQVLQNTDKSLVIFAGCSDGYLRVFRYERNSITLFSEYFFQRCILHVKILTFCCRTFVITALTNGNLCFWEYKNLDCSKFILLHKQHDSGINAIDINVDCSDNVLVVTGGDDQSVVISRFKFVQESFQCTESKTLDFVHRAQVNGIKISKCRRYFYSFSVDQNICVVDLEHFKVVRRIYSCIPDAKGLELCCDCDHTNVVFVYGSGLQIQCVDNTGHLRLNSNTYVKVS